MNLTRPLGGILAASAVAATLLTPAIARAADETPPANPAFVDLNRVVVEFRKTSAFAKYQLKMREQAKKLEEEMTTLAQLRYCTDEERVEGLALKSKTALSAKEKARMDELLKKADRVDNEIATLSQKQKPTDAEAARIVELSKMRTEAVKSLAKERAERSEELRRLEASLTADVEADLLKIVQKIAKDKKLPSVYSSRAVLFGGTDLTDEVIKKLPK